ncbi:uncharacterized protein LOC114828005, partial [Galendromus occidentalis]|uniref:Uncharacterized protein LOC114828005 n=1 Tax=Galendromus occidentalis TaxID=34638 RepID=A0AAJ7SD15_9ACAR
MLSRLVIVFVMIQELEAQEDRFRNISEKTSVDPEKLFFLIKDVMNSTDLLFVLDENTKHNVRGELMLNRLLRDWPMPYGIITANQTHFTHKIIHDILHNLSTSGDQWFDIFLPCWVNRWEDDRLNLSKGFERLFTRSNHRMGNVRWIFQGCRHLMATLQQKCGILYVNLMHPDRILGEPLDLISKCGGRVIFVDGQSGGETAMRKPTELRSSIFRHEIEFKALENLTVLCGFKGSSKDYCADSPQYEILRSLRTRINLLEKKTSQRSFGFCRERKTCHGLLGDIQERRFDLCLVNIYPTEGALAALLFPSSYYRYDELTFFAPVAIKIIGSFKSIWMPFDRLTWVLFENHLYWMVLPITGRTPDVPACLRDVGSLRLLLAVWYIASFFISITYAAVLTSFRQHPPTTSVIETLASLERALRSPTPKIRVAVFNDTKYNAILRPEEPSELIELVLKHATFCTSKQDCIKLVLARTHVFLSTDSNVKGEVGTDPKSRIIHRAKEIIDMGRYTIVLQPGSPIQRQIKDFNTILFEAGVFDKLEGFDNYRIKPNFNRSRAWSGGTDSPLTSQDISESVRGRPRKSFSESSDRGQRRKILETREDIDPELLRRAKLIPSVNPLKALQLLLDLNIAKELYIDLRLELRRELGFDAFPAYNKVLTEKKQCYPTNIEATEKHASVPLKDLLEHSVKRLLSSLPEPEFNLLEEHLTFLSKWGCDGSSGHSEYKQASLCDSLSDGNLFIVSVTSLRLSKTSEETVIFWNNPKPSSTNYCRPLRFELTKETPEVIRAHVARVEEEISDLETFVVTVRGSTLSVDFKMILSMIDGKIIQIINEVPYMAQCVICKAKPPEMNSLDSIYAKPSHLPPSLIPLSPLHARIKVMENLLKIAYNRQFELWGIPTALRPQCNAIKADIRRAFKARLGLIIDKVKQGFARIYVDLFPWYPMSNSLHKVLVHSSSVIAAAPVPLGALNEEAQEGLNK